MQKENFDRLRPSQAGSDALRRRRWMSLGAMAGFVLFSLAALWFIGRPMVRFADAPEQFRAWVDTHGLTGRVVFVAMVAFQVIVALIPGEPLEIGAGYAFGAVEGTILCLLGMALGTAIVYGFVRRFGMKVVEPFFSREEIYALPFLRNRKKLKRITFLLFFIPGTPKDVMTWAAGLTPIPLPQWLAITLTARLPSVLTSTLGGGALGVQQYRLAVIVFIATALVSLTGLLIYRQIQKRK